MNKYIEGIFNAYTGYFNYLLDEIIHPTWHSYFYWLILVSAFFFFLEIITPWRKNQPVLRKDFWLDFFYMFFNFFLFSLVIYNAASYLFVEILNDSIIGLTGWDIQSSNPMKYWPQWGILLTGFVIRDFIQWNVHRLLHRSPRLWEFHKVHHSVEEMGFAAHLRFHWMETVVYRVIEYIPLALLGISLYDFFIIHIFTLAVGHYNHSNISVSGSVTGGIFGGLISILFAFGLCDLPELTMPVVGAYGVIAAGVLVGVVVFGPLMKIIFNHPEMHIWHHAWHLPEERKSGVNFGLTLALWDFLFKTNYIPEEGRDIELGFPKLDKYPKTFWSQVTYGIITKHKNKDV